MRTHNLTITYGTSRGRDTYGYAVVTLRERGEVKARCNGGGYDMRGTVLADWLQATYQDRLKKIASRMHYRYSKGKTLKPNSAKNYLYGGNWYKDENRVSLDGGCGWSSIKRIAEAIGLTIQSIDAGKKIDVVIVTDTRPETVTP